MVTNNNAWYNLDNTANLYPATSNDRNTNVFRLSCELKEPINLDTLEKASKIALKSFSYFKVIMRRGFFWYYLESTDLEPEVNIENQRPCKRIFYKSEKSLLFRITYFGTRINLEMFHAIADGRGSIDFLRSIVYNYLKIAHKDELPENIHMDSMSIAPFYQSEDSFDKHYKPGKTKSPFKKKSFKLGGTLLPSNSVQIISARISTKQMLAITKENNATITAYIAAVMICAIYEEQMPKRLASRDICVTVPVDLRSFFSSQSSRNFFGVVDIVYNFKGNPIDFDKVLQSATSQLKEKATVENLSLSFNYNMTVQKNLFARIAPLLIKDIALNLAFKKSEGFSTCAVTNLGKVTMPDELKPYIDSFSCLISVGISQKVKLAVISYEDNLVLNFSSSISETGIQKYIVRHLTSLGIGVQITSNNGSDYYETL